MAELDYVNPVSIAGMAGSTLGNPENPNIGPLQGALAGQAYTRANQFLDMRQQAEQMNLAEQGQKLQEFMGAAPYRQAANVSGLQSQAATSQYTTGQMQGKIARLPGENQIAQMKQTNEFQQAYQALDQNKKDYMASIWPTISNSLVNGQEVTNDTRMLWEAAKQQWNAQVPPDDRIQPGSNNEYLMEPNAYSLAALKMVHDQVIADKEQQQKLGVVQEQGRQQRLTQAEEWVQRRGQTMDTLNAQKDISKAEIEGRIKVASIEKNLNNVQKETIDAMSKKDAALHMLDPTGSKAGDPKAAEALEREAEGALTPRERALIDPNLFQRVFPTYSMGFDQRGLLTYYTEYNKFRAMMNAIEPGPGQGGGPIQPQQSVPQTQQPNQQGAPLMEIKSQQDYDKLPTGSRYIYRGQSFVKGKK